MELSLTCRKLQSSCFQYSGISRQFDTSAMAKACDGFTIGTVLAAINEVGLIKNWEIHRMILMSRRERFLYDSVHSSPLVIFFCFFMHHARLRKHTGNDHKKNGAVTNSSFDARRIGERVKFQGSGVSRGGGRFLRFVIDASMHCCCSEMIAIDTRLKE